MYAAEADVGKLLGRAARPRHSRFVLVHATTVLEVISPISNASLPTQRFALTEDDSSPSGDCSSKVAKDRLTSRHKVSRPIGVLPDSPASVVCLRPRRREMKRTLTAAMSILVLAGIPAHAHHRPVGFLLDQQLT